jgi:hypothetical protein
LQFNDGETLEEAILTANVPGRYSKWDKGEDRDERRGRGREERGDEGDGEEEEPDGYK